MTFRLERVYGKIFELSWMASRCISASDSSSTKWIMFWRYGWRSFCINVSFDVCAGSFLKITDEYRGASMINLTHIFPLANTLVGA